MEIDDAVQNFVGELPILCTTMNWFLFAHYRVEETVTFVPEHRIGCLRANFCVQHTAHA
jgi:hypothetical protein